jgi:hypothetical protein
VNGFTERYIDTTCSPISPDANEEWKCVFDEESGGGISLDNNICSCFGLLWCESDDCGGNQCVLSTYDMNKHCKYADEPVFGSFFGAGACSNSRAADNACEAFNGADSATTDSLQIGIEAGVVGMGCVVLLGAGLTVRKIAQRRTMGPKSAEAEMTGKLSGTNPV